MTNFEASPKSHEEALEQGGAGWWGDSPRLDGKQQSHCTAKHRPTCSPRRHAHKTHFGEVDQEQQLPKALHFLRPPLHHHPTATPAPLSQTGDEVHLKHPGFAAPTVMPKQKVEGTCSGRGTGAAPLAGSTGGSSCGAGLAL